jgi:flagellar motor switch protein FliG
MGKQASQRFLGTLTETEREKITQHLYQVESLPTDLVEKVIREFNEKAKQAKLGRARSTEKGTESDAPPGPVPSGLKTLQALKAEDLVDLVKGEHPQTLAIILVHVQTDVASKVLSSLPDDIKTDVALRIANMNRVVSGMVEEIDQVFEQILKNKKTSVTSETGGVGRLADILNQSDGLSSEMILREIEDSNPELAAQIKQRMFVFEDLVLIDNQGMQKLLRRVETGELALALKAASDEVKEKIFRNVSQRAGEMLAEEIEALGAVRMTDVVTAQQTITRIIQEMESKGELVIGGRRGEQFVV